LIEVLTSTIVREVRGHIGNYELLVHNRQLGMDLPLQVGVIIVATGAKELKPAGLFGYDEDPRVITQGELETLLATDGIQPLISEPQSPIPTVVMIQCAGARDEKRPYCGRTCCLTAMKNAMLIKEHSPGTEVHVLYRDIEVHGTHFEDYYSQARDWGVIFTRYAPHDPPRVADGKVVVYDELLGAPLGISFDLLVLSTPLVPRPGARELAQMLKVPVDEHGFFLEAHVKLRPLDCATDGVYLCGSAHWPAHLDEAISQAYGAAARAATVLSKEQIRASGAVAHVDDRLCRGCERCADSCEFGAVQFVKVDGSKATFVSVPSLDGRAAPENQPTSRKVAWVNPVLCKGCGACAVLCPTGAMQAAHYTDAQMKAMVQAALGGRGGRV
jgi:heterodisulfide reductase subunit A